MQNGDLLCFFLILLLGFFLQGFDLGLQLSDRLRLAGALSEDLTIY